jgi:hypothetical protein
VYKVQVGPFSSVVEIDAALPELQALGFSDPTTVIE